MSLTSAASYVPGSSMAITDTVLLLGRSPLLAKQEFPVVSYFTIKAAGTSSGAFRSFTPLLTWPEVLLSCLKAFTSTSQTSGPFGQNDDSPVETQIWEGLKPSHPGYQSKHASGTISCPVACILAMDHALSAEVRGFRPSEVADTYKPRPLIPRVFCSS